MVTCIFSSSAHSIIPRVYGCSCSVFNALCCSVILFNRCVCGCSVPCTTIRFYGQCRIIDSPDCINRHVCGCGNIRVFFICSCCCIFICTPSKESISFSGCPHNEYVCIFIRCSQHASSSCCGCKCKCFT